MPPEDPKNKPVVQEQRLQIEHIMANWPADVQLVLCGDLNAHHPVWGMKSSNENGRWLMAIMTQYNLTLTNPHEEGKWVPTYYKFGQDPKMLDLFLTKIPQKNVVTLVNLHRLSSDHHPV